MAETMTSDAVDQVPAADAPVEVAEKPPEAPPKAAVKKKATLKKAVPKKKAPPRSPLEQASAAIKSVLKEADPSVAQDPHLLTASMPHISSGSIVLNHLIGGTLNRFGVPPCPGFPRGRIVNLYGHESSGKTTIALEASAAVCAQGGTVCFVDWENAIDPSYAKALGVPIEDRTKFYHAQPDTLEQGLVVMWAMAAAGVDLIVIDSVGAGVPREIFEQALEDQGNLGRVGKIAAVWSSFLPKLKAMISTTRTAVVGISQLRKNINTRNSHGDGYIAQGGEAWKFYSAIRIKLRRVQSQKGKVYDAITHKKIERMVSSTIKAKIDKSKVSSAQQAEAEFTIRFGSGVDNLRDCVDIASAHGRISKSGAWYSWELPGGEELRGQGMEGFMAKIREENQVLPAYETAARCLLEAGGTFVAPEEQELDLSAISFITGDLG